MRISAFLKSKWLYDEFLRANREEYLNYQREYNRTHPRYAKKWPKEKVLKMVELHNQWLSQAKIADIMWCSRQNVNTALKIFFKNETHNP